MRIVKKPYKIWLHSFIILVIILIAYHHVTSDYYIKNKIGMTAETSNKTYPEILEKPILKALSYYPELNSVPIEFKLKKNIKKSTMQAQPKFNTLLRSRNKRAYVILIKAIFELNTTSKPIQELPEDVLIGWFGHELGHIMDYETKTNNQLISFGYNYLFSENTLKNAERIADSFAVSHGMRDYLMTTKNYILNDADIPEDYKKRIRDLYVSPEELMQKVVDSTKTP